MIVDKFELRTETLGVFATLNVAGIASDDPYVVKAATGLDATSLVAINYGSSNSGVRFFEMELEPREIVMRIGLNPEYSDAGEREDLREDLYRAIAASRTPDVYLDLWRGSNFLATIGGVISKLESSYFTAKPEVQLTLTCAKPIFKAPTRTIVDVSGFTSEELVIDVENGTAPTGFVAEFTILSAISQFGISAPDNSWGFVLNYNFVVGDVLHFSSEDGSRYVYIYRPSLHVGESDGIVQLADKLNVNSVWPILFPGENSFSIDVIADSISYDSMSYYPSYWGV